MARSRGLGNWQAELDALLKKSRDKSFLKDFESLQTDADRIKFMCDRKLLSDIGWLRDYFTELCQELRSKDAERAAHHKEEGNKLFLAGRDQQALLTYTQSMQFAPCGTKCDDSGTDLGLAYGNRSAVLFRLHKYQECLTDIDRALAAGFPSRSQHKLLVRRCLCHARLGHEERAKEAQANIRSQMQCCDPKTARHLEGELAKIEAQIQSVKGRPTDKSGSSDAQTSPEPSVSHGANSILVQASSAVEMRTSPAQGRFLQAKQPIKAGDTLIVERPFAAVLLPPHYSTHCLHCFAVLPDNPVGCRECSGVLYCNEACRDASWETYHYVECRYMDLLHSVGIAHLSLRIVLTARLSFLMDFLEQRGRGGGRGIVPGVTEEGRYERNYLSVYDLMTHTSDMVTDDLFQYSLTATVLLGILLHSGWFICSRNADSASLDTRNTNLLAFLQGKPTQTSQHGKCPDVPRVFAVGGVLLRHVQQLVCNAHAITALQVTQVSEQHLVETQSQVRVATAIYPTASLMNHSCDPTIISSFQRDVLIVKSVCDVPRGGEIFNCYGPHCKRMKRQERQRELKTQYFFDCQCHACLNDQDGQAATSQGLQCPDCGGILSAQQPESACPSCHATIDMAAILSQLQSADADFSEGVKHLENGDHKRALVKFESCLKVRSKVMSPNNHDLGQAHDAVAQCLASKGDYAKAADHLVHSLAVTEAVFGKDGIETARELHKMAEVQIHAGRPKDALRSTSRALSLAGKLYPQSDEWVQELLCLKTGLTKIIDEDGFR